MKQYVLILFVGICHFVFSAPCHADSNQANQANQAKYSKEHILYLIQVGEVTKGMRLYQSLVKETGKHDFAILEQIGYILLNVGAKSGDEESLLLTMYALGIATSTEGIDLYALGIKSAHPMTQIATIQCLSRLQDDRVEDLLFQTFSSPFLPVRLEAAYVLAMHRSEKLVGMLESLMQTLPPHMHLYFPDLLAMVGTSDGIGVLKRLIGHPYLPVRIASISSAAKYKRDDVLSEIRAGATHSDPAEQEACVSALGRFNDSHSISLLKRLATSPHLNVKLSACLSLYQLGDEHFQQPILDIAKQNNLFAIGILAHLSNTTPLLTSLVEDPQFSTRVNAALALLDKRSPKSVPTLLDILIQDQNDFGFQPTYSLGHSCMAWKVIPSAAHHLKKYPDLPSLTLSLKESILMKAIELPEEAFLTIVRHLFQKKEHSLIPLAIHLLENLNTPQAIALLETQAEQLGAPFVRAYCHLALYRLNNEPHHAAFIYNWIQSHADCELFEFRNPLALSQTQDRPTSCSLTPKETSQLLIEGYEALAENHGIKGIDLLIEGIEKGHQKNRYILAGLLLKAIQ